MIGTGSLCFIEEKDPVMRKLIDSDTVDGFLLVVEPIGKDV